MFDRPEVEVPRGMEPTGTNGRTRHTLSDPCGSGLVLWWFSRWMARNAVSCGHDDTGKAFIARVRCPVPGPPRSESWSVPLPAAGFPVGRSYWFCGGHGPGETPGPIPNPEAKAWHGDGTALERVWESSTSPHLNFLNPELSVAPRDFSLCDSYKSNYV